MPEGRQNKRSENNGGRQSGPPSTRLLSTATSNVGQEVEMFILETRTTNTELPGETSQTTTGNET